jgi:IS4 transposase
LSPAASLTANSQTGASNRYYIHVQAAASDPDGAADISSIALTLKDGKGRTLKQWSLSDFSKADDSSWAFESSYRVSGKEPWTLTLVVTDRAGQSATQSVTITR